MRKDEKYLRLIELDILKLKCFTHYADAAF